MRRFFHTTFFAVCPWLAALAAGLAAPVRAHEADVEQLLAGVRQIPVIGAPGAVIPFGPEAFPLVVGSDGSRMAIPVVAAARLGQGRIVAFGHGGYLEPAGGDLAALVANAIRWAAGERGARSGGPRVVVYRGEKLLARLTADGFSARGADRQSWESVLGECDVLCIDTSFDDNAQLAAATGKFVAAGGGLVTAGTGWGWAQLNPGKSLADDYLGNRVLAPSGLVVSDAMPEGTADRYGVSNRPPALAGAAAALEALSAAAPPLSTDDRQQASQILVLAVRALPPGDELLVPRLRALVVPHARVPMPHQPVKIDDPLARLAVAVADIELLRTPPEKIVAHPAAVGFPFSVPAKSPSQLQRRTIDTATPDWHSLGLYAPAGTVIRVSVPASAAGKKLAVQIGCHTDRLWHLAEWRRWPNLVRRATIDATETRIASPFGGLVYLDVPNNCPLGRIDVTVQGAIEAPLFVLGKTSLADWRSRIRRLPGPWAELASPGIIVTVPSEAIRALDDPQSLMNFWNRAVELEDTLAAWKPGDRKRPERFVADEQISAGYMHSGYPIMCGNDVYDDNVSIDLLRGVPDRPGGWGQWHELGHNHQVSDWTPTGGGEVTVNLFSMYVINQMYGVPLAGTRPDALSPDVRQAKLRGYLASNRTCANWDPFEGLLLYFQLIDAFGWQKLNQVLGEYRDLPQTERPQTDVERWDQWMVRYSKATGKNLGPFFVRWKVPVSAAALETIEPLPEWQHSDFAAP